MLTAVIQYPGEETADEIQAMLDKNRNDLVKLCTEHPNAYDPEDEESPSFKPLFNNVQQLTRRKEELLRRAQADEDAGHEYRYRDQHCHNRQPHSPGPPSSAAHSPRGMNTVSTRSFLPIAFANAFTPNVSVS